MPSRQFITIRVHNSNKQVDLEVPAEEPIREFLPDLIKVINWPEMIKGGEVEYYFTNESDQKLDSSQSLFDLGVENFEMLWINADANGLDQKPNEKEAADTAVDNMRRDLPLPPAWAQIPIEDPSLVSEQGVVFMLGEPPVSIGRKSKQFTPDIDLTEWDSKLLSSRRHAEITKDGKGFVLQAFNTTNGTFINSSELPAGEKKKLNEGDKIQFGFRGVELIFRLT